MSSIEVGAQVVNEFVDASLANWEAGLDEAVQNERNLRLQRAVALMTDLAATTTPEEYFRMRVRGMELNAQTERNKLSK